MGAIYISKEKLEKLYSQGLSFKNIAIEFGVTSATICNYFKKYGIKARPAGFQEIPHFGKLLCHGCRSWRRTDHFEKYKTKNGIKLRRKICKYCRNLSRKNLPKRKKYYLIDKIGRQNFKEEIIQKYNSKCSVCEKELPSCVFEFHHLNPSEKEYNVSTLIQYYKNKERAYNEIKKCIMVCANCHKIIHNGGG